MDSQRRRIPPNEWKSWKDTILGLTRKESTKNLMTIMKDTHGFDASLSQYESQLRLWGCRKNLSPDEWAHVFEIVDKLKSQRKDFRILVSGKLVDDIKIERMRRRCKKHRNPNRTIQGNSAKLLYSSVEVRGTCGNWIPYANPNKVVDDAQNQARDSFASPTTINIGNATTKTSFNDELEPHDRGCASVGGFDMRLSTPIDASDFSGLQDNDNRVVWEEDWLTPVAVSALSLPMTIGHPLPQRESSLPFGIESESSSWDFPPWPNTSTLLSSPVSQIYIARHNLNSLPLKQLMKDIGLSRNNPIHRSLNSGSGRFSATHSPVTVFQADIISSISGNDATQKYKRSSDVTHLLSSLRSLLPNVGPQGGHENGRSLMTEDQMHQTNLAAILMSSTADGFAGLEDIPIQCVLNYLRRCVNIDLLSKACHSHIGKAFAENLFRAAIEAKDRGALKCLLDIPSIDIDSILCIVNGRRYTPLERAVSLLDFGMVKIFLDAGAGVNKTCDLDASERGILGTLSDSILGNVGVSPDVIAIGKLLLRSGAKLHLHIVQRALQGHNLPGLAFDLISSVTDSDHSKLIRGGFLSLIAVNLDDEQAAQATKNIIMACERTGCHKCRTEYEGKLDWALIQAAKRGHLELVRLLLLHSKTPHRALSGAIRSGVSEVVETILTLKPDINAPAHSIDHEMWSLEVSSSENATTSYAEAIEAGNEKLLHEMENKGALELLSQGGRFPPAITATSRIGNIVHTRKLLESCPSPIPSCMGNAVVYAIQEGHEDCFWALITAGANLNMSRDPDPLFAAVWCKNPGIVRAILNADTYTTPYWRRYLYKGVNTTTIKEAIKWGDRGIIQDLLSAFPGATLEYGDLLCVLEMGDVEMFEFLLECGVVSNSALTCSLEFGLRRDDTELVQKLVERGADPSNSRILATCVRKYPAMLPFLWKHTSLRKRSHIVPGYGTDALRAAIEGGQAGLAALNFLLGTELIDAKSFSSVGSTKHLTTPLGLAINVSRNGQHTSFEVIKKLLDYGCDPNSTVRRSDDRETNTMQTALLEAIDTGSADLVELLITRGARVNQEAKLGLKRTPLQKAVEVDSLEIVTLLLKWQADVNAAPAYSSGATAFQLAAIRGNRIIAAKLLEHGANMFAPPAQINGRWPLEGAAENGRLQMIYFLWEVSKDCFDVEVCQRAMELARENGYMACRGAIEELLQERVAALLEFE